MKKKPVWGLLPMLFWIVILLLLAFLAKNPASRTGPDNGLIQSDYHVWKDMPLHREDLDDAQDFVNKPFKP